LYVYTRVYSVGILQNYLIKPHLYINLQLLDLPFLHFLLEKYKEICQMNVGIVEDEGHYCLR